MSYTGGDWLCGACQHVNFKKRETCQKCNFPKYGNNTQADISSYNCNNNNHNNRSTQVVLAGDWYCQSHHCGVHNYASRTCCFRCGTLKSLDYGPTSDVMMMGANGGDTSDQFLPGWKAGDWVCIRPECGLHNYACRMECYKCKTPRHFGGAM